MQRKKIGVWLIMTIILLGNIVPYPIFAQSQNSNINDYPLVCSSTPESMQLFLDFQREAINLIAKKTFPLESANIGQLESGLFSHGVLQLKSNNTITNILAHIGNSTSKLLIQTATTSLLFAVSAVTTAISSPFSTIKILFAERPIVRDRAKIMDLEREVSKLIYYIWKDDLLTRKISNTQEFQQLIEYYKQQGLFSNNSNFNNNTSYANLLSFLGRQNTKVKYFLLRGISLEPDEKMLLKGTETEAESEDKPDFTIYFHPDRANKIKNDYIGTRAWFGFKCNKSFQKFSTNTKGIFKNFWEETTNSRGIIKQAGINLREALMLTPKGVWNNIKGKDTEPYLTEREKELLRSVYGLKTSQMTRETKTSILNISKQTRNNFLDMKNNLYNIRNSSITAANHIQDTAKIFAKNSSQSWANVKKTFKNFRAGTASILKKGDKISKKDLEKQLIKDLSLQEANSIISLIEQRNAQDILNKFQEEFPNESAKDSFNLAMISWLLRLQQEQNLDKYYSQDTLPAGITFKFWELSNSIKRVIYSIGNKDHGLRYVLNQRCTFQAQNKGTKGCYIP